MQCLNQMRYQHSTEENITHSKTILKFVPTSSVNPSHHHVDNVYILEGTEAFIFLVLFTLHCDKIYENKNVPYTTILK